MTDPWEGLMLKKYPGLWGETNLMMNFGSALSSFVTWVVVFSC